MREFIMPFDNLALPSSADLLAAGRVTNIRTILAGWRPRPVAPSPRRWSLAGLRAGLTLLRDLRLPAPLSGKPSLLY
jgi:hypothetical protein